MTAPAWPGLPITWDRAAATPQPEISSGECLTHGNESSARSTRTPWPPGTTRQLDRGGGGPGRRPGPVRRLLPVQERVLGPEHPDTLAARANLARWTGEAGDAAAARDLFAALLPVASGSSARSTRGP